MTDMPIRRGVHLPLEAAADALIKESLKEVTRHVDKSDILTPWKEHERRRREVMVPSGTPDPAIRAGIFNRAINQTSPHLNSRMGQVRGKRVTALYSGLDGSDENTMPSPGVTWDSE